MAKTAIHTILFLLLGQLVKSQSLATTPLTVKSQKAQTYSYTNENRLVYFIRDAKTLHVLVYDTALALIKSSDFELEDFIHKSEGVIAISEIDNKPTLFFGDKKLKSFSCVSLNLNSFQMEQFNFPELNDDEFYLNSFSTNNKLYLIGLKKKKPFDMVVREVQPNHSMTEHIIPLSDLNLDKEHDDFTDLFLGGNENFAWWNASRSSKLKKIRGDEPNNNVSASASTKFYNNENSLIITLDHNYDCTYVITIDLKTFQRTFKKIKYEIAALKEDEDFIGNSFLLNKNLYHIASSQERLLLNVKDFESGNTIKEFVTTAKEPILYKSGAFMSETDGAESPVRWETKKFLKKISRSGKEYSLGAGAFVNTDDELELTIGNSAIITLYYYPFLLQPYHYCNPSAIFPAFSNMPVMHSAPGGFRMLLPTLLWTEGSSSPVSSTDNYYFRAFFNKNDLTPITHTSEDSFNGKLNRTVKRIGGMYSTWALNTTQFRRQTFIAYFNNDTKQFVTGPFQMKDDK